MSTTTRGRADRRPSITDVAKLAGVSVGTVSNVLNRPDQVSENTRDRVLVAIEELQFVRNASARQLRAGTIQTVGAIVLDIANPFFTEVARGVEDRLAADEYTLMLARPTRTPSARPGTCGCSRSTACRASWSTRPPARWTACSALRDRGIDVVLLDTTSPVDDISSVAVDDVRGGALAVEHLVASGTPASRSSTGRRRSSSASTAARACSPRSPPPASTPPTRSSRSPSARSTPRAARPASTGSSRPTATARPPCSASTTSPRSAPCARCGPTASPSPREMAVVGYDDVVFASMLTVPLTSVRQPTHQLGWTAADLLLRQRSEGASFQHQRVQFQPELVVRGSSDPSA